MVGLDSTRLPASCAPQCDYDHAPGKRLVWIVFKGAGEIGRFLVDCVLSKGDFVTSVGEPTIKETFNQGSNHFEVVCDIRARDSVSRAVQSTVDHFGRIDVVVTCSDHWRIGACEDQDEHEIRSQFETNFMGTLHMIQVSLPIFRRQHSGRYLVFNSSPGNMGVPGLGPYCAAKYAVEGLVESLSFEMDAFNIKATLVELGPTVRSERQAPAEPVRNWSRVPWSQVPMKQSSEFYSQATSPALHAKRMMQWQGQRQPTSMTACAELGWQLAHCSHPPLRLPLGSYAVESIRDRLRCATEELDDWKHLNFSNMDTGDSVKDR